jgi:REP element-mobilizing transposase RayT
MPRKARIDAPGALHHIICRGIERKRIFRDDHDQDDFVDRLGAILGDTSTSCFAWALIPNHFHLLLQTGPVPIATVMRRLLTGYALAFNRRHKRHGQLFQNRYKSILCDENTYLLELVRYIHLNPLRARLVQDLSSLDKFPYSGHSVLLGHCQNKWQEIAYILACFDKKLPRSKQRYKEFVEQGVTRGKRPELTGGGLIRSLGGWSAATESIRNGGRVKGDERILGDSFFVDQVLSLAEEELERRYRLKAMGFGLDDLAGKVADIFNIEPGKIFLQGKYPRVVQARSLFCYWAVRELGATATSLAKRLQQSQPAVSIAVRRGEKIAHEAQYALTVERNL